MSQDEGASVSSGTREVPTGKEALAGLRAVLEEGTAGSALSALRPLVDTAEELSVWLGAARLLPQLRSTSGQWARRSIRVGVVGTSTTTHLAMLLPLALARHGVHVEVYESPYGQLEQEVLDERSGLYAFGPDVVLLAPDARALHLPEVSTDPATTLAAETAKWTSIWQLLRSRTSATVVQVTFVDPPGDPLGSFALAVPGARSRLVRELNLALGAAVRPGVLLVDAERVAADVGRAAWHDARYWFQSKHGVGLAALPALLRATAAVIAASLGLTRKCVVVDLDNTLWGGVVGEDGVDGLVLGNGPAGEAFVAFQEYLLRLRERGVLLALLSKNNEADARAPFDQHPDMRLRWDSFSAAVASWEDKPSGLRRIAEQLGLGLDALVFLDDNPVEREAVRQTLPDVEVVVLPGQPSGYIDALVRNPTLEPASWTREDAARADQYAARAQAQELAASIGSREEFLRSLDMVATVEPLSESNLERVVQLLGKTNQFNVTTRRHSADQVSAMVRTPGSVCLALRLRDTFADHGLVAVVLAVPDTPEALRIDTWLMSCRVLGRGLEGTTMRIVADHARARGFLRLLGEFIPSPRNAPAAGAFEMAGFRRVSAGNTGEVLLWELGPDDEPRDEGFIAVVDHVMREEVGV